MTKSLIRTGHTQYLVANHVQAYGAMKSIKTTRLMHVALEGEIMVQNSNGMSLKRETGVRTKS